MSRPWLKLASIVLFLLAWNRSSALEPASETGVFAVDPPTPYIHYLPSQNNRGRVLVVHGLDASKEVMRMIAAALADGGFEVYNIDLPGHGDSPAGFQAPLAGEVIRKVMEQIGKDTAVLGHSMGAGLLMDLAEDQHFSAMALLAPPPLAVSRIQADRVLIAAGNIDLPRIRAFVPIAADIGGPRAESWILPFGAHSAPIFNPRYVRRTVEWLGGDGTRVRTVSRFAWLGAMFGAAVLFGFTLMPAREAGPSGIHIPTVLVRYVVAGGAALLVLRFMNPLSWLRLFATSYVVGFVFIAGLAGCFGVRRKTGSAGFSQRGPANAGPYYSAIAAAAFVIIVIGRLNVSQILHFSLSDGRWWRFPSIALASLPLFLFDEWSLRRIQPFWKAAAGAVISRGILWALLLTGVQVLNRENAFLVLIAHLITVFWIALWLAGEIVYRRTRDPIATALFASIVQGWAFAAWFVTI